MAEQHNQSYETKVPNQSGKNDDEMDTGQRERNSKTGM